jgi:hypothetical protein
VAAPRFEDVLPDLADRGGVVLLMLPGSRGLVTGPVRRLAAARTYNLRAPHHSVSAKGLVQEAGLASDGLLFLDEADELSQLARRKLMEYLENMYGGMVPIAIIATVNARVRDGEAPEEPRAFALELGDAMELEVLAIDSEGLVEALVPTQPLESPTAQLDLAEINRHRASIYQPALDPEAAGWGPDDLRAEVERIRALNPWGEAKARLLTW